MEALVEGVVPEVEAPDGSGCLGLEVITGVCFGLVPEVDGVGDECGELQEVELLESVSGGGAGADAAAGGTAGGSAGFVVDGVVLVSVGPNGCNLGIEVQLY